MKKNIQYKSSKSKLNIAAEPPATYGSSFNFEEMYQKVWTTLNEIAERQKKFDEEMEKSRKEWEEYKKESQKRIKQLEDLFTSQWGKLVEALLSPGCKKIFKERGINIHYSGSNVEAEINGEKMEIDVLLENENDVVVIEVKTTAKVKHINELIEELKDIKRFFPRFEGKNIYGAIAALKFHEGSDKYAESKGIFVIEPSGENFVTIKNLKDFKPKKW
jgi:Holliday junction resolvase